MKNERIHELDKRLILMETVVCAWKQLGVGGDVASAFSFLVIFSVKRVEERRFEEAPAWATPVLALETAETGLWPVWVKQGPLPIWALCFSWLFLWL